MKSRSKNKLTRERIRGDRRRKIYELQCELQSIPRSSWHGWNTERACMLLRMIERLKNET